MQAGWKSWRKVTGVMCDKRLPAKLKGKVYKTVVRPAMLYGLETEAITKIKRREDGGCRDENATLVNGLD
jgi:hypothetical protein